MGADAGQITLTVSAGKVTGQVTGEYHCGSGVKIGSFFNPHLQCGPFDGTLQGTVDAAGTMTARFTGSLHAQTSNGTPVTWPQIGDFQGRLGNGASGGTVTIWEYSKWTNSNDFRMHGTWMATRH